MRCGQCKVQLVETLDPTWGAYDSSGRVVERQSSDQMLFCLSVVI